MTISINFPSVAEEKDNNSFSEIILNLYIYLL